MVFKHEGSLKPVIFKLTLHCVYDHNADAFREMSLGSEVPRRNSSIWLEG